jgi:hypothetical protein
MRFTYRRWAFRQKTRSRSRWESAEIHRGRGVRVERPAAHRRPVAQARRVERVLPAAVGRGALPLHPEELAAARVEPAPEAARRRPQAAREAGTEGRRAEPPVERWAPGAPVAGTAYKPRDMTAAVVAAASRELRPVLRCSRASGYWVSPAGGAELGGRAAPVRGNHSPRSFRKKHRPNCEGSPSGRASPRRKDVAVKLTTVSSG